MTDPLTRREVLVTGAASLAALAIADPLALSQCVAPPNQSSNQPQPGNGAPGRTRVLRLAHLSDVTVQPERRANDGLIACLRHVQNLRDPPQLILSGGATLPQWDLWRSILKQECSLPVHHCVGNHNTSLWWERRLNIHCGETNYDMFGLPGRYWSFDAWKSKGPGNSGGGAGWHFIVLDSLQPSGHDGYLAFIDKEQLDWLQRELQNTPVTTNVLILSHIPILTAAAPIWAKPDEDDSRVSGSFVHLDCERLTQLFAQHPGVKLCLSGDLHVVDRVDYNGVTYLRNGAVSGVWWKSWHKGCDEGYAVIDLFDDGSFQREYITYGEKAAV